LAEVEEELAIARDQLGELELENRGDLSETGGQGAKVDVLTSEVEDMRRRYEEADDLSQRMEWEMEQLRSQSELATLKAKESLREELQTAHARELRVRDDLIQMLRAKLAELEGASQATVKKGPITLKEPRDEDPGGDAREAGDPTGDESGSLGGEPVKVTRKVTLPSLLRFSGEKLEDGAFERWTKKLLRPMQSWRSGQRGKTCCNWSYT